MSRLRSKGVPGSFTSDEGPERLRALDKLSSDLDSRLNKIRRSFNIEEQNLSDKMLMEMKKVRTMEASNVIVLVFRLSTAIMFVFVCLCRQHVEELSDELEMRSRFLEGNERLLADIDKKTKAVVEQQHTLDGQAARIVELELALQERKDGLQVYRAKMLD